MSHFRNLIILSITTLMLSACNSGTGTNSSDIQTNQVSNSNYSMSYTATGCKTMGSNGNCNISVTYSGTGNYATNLQINNLIGYTNTISSGCPNKAQSAPTTCSFVVSANGNTSVQNPTIAFGSTGSGLSFQVGQ